MNAFFIAVEPFAWLADASIGLVLTAKWTLLLALAWLVHAGLASCNPRWRVALWRGVMLGIGLVAVLSPAPPIARLRIAAEPEHPAAARHDGPAKRPLLELPSPVVAVPATVSRPTEARAAVLPVGQSHRDHDGPPNSPPAAALAAPAPRLEPELASRFFHVLSLAASWALWVWLAGVVLLTARLVLSAFALDRIIQRSTNAPEAISHECKEVAKRLGCGRVVRIRISAEVATPCLAGLFKLVLLLPRRESSADEPDDADLPAILAHELTHVRQHDVAWNLVAHLATIALWFHPLAWRIRAAHATACDAVADAVAADFVGNVVSYAQTLARIAMHAASPPSAHVLAMARTSEVWGRLDALNRRVFQGPLSRRHACLALCVGVVFLCLIGGFGVTRAGQEKGQPERSPSARAKTDAGPKADQPLRQGAANAAGRLVLHAVAAATGEPIDAVAIEYQGRFDGKYRRETVMTGADGAAAIEWGAGVKLEQLWITARSPGFVPIHVLWTDERRPIQLPATKELRFEPGTTIGGIVKDENRQPVAHATVEVYLPATESDLANYSFLLGRQQTDAQGRWRLDVAPQNIASLYSNVAHPRFRKGGGAVSHDLDSVIVLKRGLTLTGRVVSAGGRPVTGASVRLGHSIWGTNPPQGTSNERGDFTLENCDSGASIITIQADGFAPQISDVRVEEKNAPVIVQLTEPAATVRGKVVDAQGKPVAGAFVAADTWRGHRSIRFRVDTDSNGRFEWTNAPKDAVLYDFGKLGYMASRQVPLAASDREHSVVLYPILEISGRVTDAKSGRPIEKFRVVQGRRFEGQDRVYWALNEGVNVAEGRFVSRFDDPSAALFVRVEAAGYKPAESRAFRPSEGRQTIDLALEPADGFSAIVQRPDGSPAAGAEVALATRERMLSLRSGYLDRNANVPRFTTDDAGRCSFTPPDDRFLLVAVSAAGFAEAFSDEVTKTYKLVLQPWGRIEGGVRIGARSGANQEVTFYPTRPAQRGGMYVFDYGYTTRTDDRGRFEFDRVIPGPGTVSRVVVTEFPGGSSLHTGGWEELVEIKPRETAQVKIGGKGRPVIGHVVLDATPEVPVDWAQNEPATITTPRKEWGKAGRRIVRFAANFDRDGRFRIEDVPAGQYELLVAVNAAADPAFCGAGTKIAQANIAVTIPEMAGGRSTEPLDLGTITAKLFETIKVRDLAPDFTAQRLGGTASHEPLKLSSYQGKLVLLDFWATWCGPCLAEMPALKEIHETFRDDSRFALISISCDNTPELADGYLKQNPSPWIHGFAGNLQAGLAASYKVRAIPATFLIGPDGRILAKNLRGAALKDAIVKALKDKTLFAATAWAARPSRFPVTRFAAGAKASDPGPVGKPTVVVLDDCDEDFEEDRPHHDTLRIISTDERAEGDITTLSFAEYNTCQTGGGSHGVAIDRERKRIYIRELVARRVIALDFLGHKLWQTDNIDGGSLAVDPRTGHIWCTVGRDLVTGETVVLDASGQEVASFPVRGIDIAYDPHSDAFWLAGHQHNGLTKLSRAGKLLFHKPCEGFAFVSIDVNPRDGSVWAVERAHQDVARSANRLWHLDSSGGVIKALPLGEKPVFGVACDPQSGTAWAVVLHSDILRFTADGGELPSLPIKALALSISPTTGQVWVATETEVIGLDTDGRPAVRSSIGPKSAQAWLAAY